MADKKKILQAQIADIETNINSDEFSEGVKERLRSKKESLEAQLAALGDKPAKVFKTSAEKKTDKKPAAKKEKPAKTEKKSRLPKPTTKDKLAAKRKAPKVKKAAPKPAKAKKQDDDDDSNEITIQGVTISKKDCPDGYDAFVAAKKAKTKSAEKSEAKPSIEKAHHSFHTGVSQIFDSISKSKIEGSPDVVKKALKGFKADISRGFDRLAVVLGAGKVKELKDALKKIDEIIDSIE